MTSQALGTSLGTSTTILGLANSLSSLGHDVHILAPGERTKKTRRNLTIHGYGGPLTGYTGLLTKKAYESRRFARKTVLRPRILKLIISNLERYVVKWANRLSLDIIEGHQELASSACISAGSKLRTRSVSRFHNVWFEECLELGLLSERDTEFQFLKELTGSIVEDSESVITPTPYMKQYFLTNLYPSDHSRIVPVWPGATPQRVPIIPDNVQRRIVYSGSLNQLEGLPLYVQAASLVPKLNISICGKGNGALVAKLAKSLNRDVQFCWFENRRDYIDYLSHCCAGVVPWGRTQSRLLGFPMKLLDYISVGLPVIASKIGSWSDCVAELGFGIVSEPNSTDWAKSLSAILEDDGSRRTMGMKGFEASRTVFSWDKSVAKILEVYEGLLDPSDGAC